MNPTLSQINNNKQQQQSACMIGLFVSLTWTTGSLTTVIDHSYALRINTGVGAASQNNSLTRNKLTNVSCAPDGVRTSGHWILSPTLYQLSHSTTPNFVYAIAILTLPSKPSSVQLSHTQTNPPQTKMQIYIISVLRNHFCLAQQNRRTISTNNGK